MQALLTGLEVVGLSGDLFTGHVNNVRVVHSELIAGSLESNLNYGLEQVNLLPGGAGQFMAALDADMVSLQLCKLCIQIEISIKLA
jgi:hypothetical protein